MTSPRPERNTIFHTYHFSFCRKYSCISDFNKKVLLRDRKRRTARGVACGVREWVPVSCRADSTSVLERGGTPALSRGIPSLLVTGLTGERIGN